MIILNEKEYAMECLRNGNIDGKPFTTLSILAKYYYYELEYSKKKITDLLTEFMEKYYVPYEYDIMNWQETIDNIVSNVNKYKLYQIDNIGITKKEIEKIQNIGNKSLEKIIFTMLCLAKLGNEKNVNNNDWVKNDAKEIFQLARVTCNVTERYMKLNQLKQLGLLEFPKKNDNLSSRVTFIDKESNDYIIQINDFRELGYEYLNYLGENFIRCGECGILTRNNKRGTKKYCSKCVGYNPMETKTVICVDCGCEFEVDARNNRSERCDECYIQHRKEQKLANQRNRRVG